MIVKAIENFLSGQILISMPSIGDPRFHKSLIYVCSHTNEGAMGIVVNKLVEGINMNECITNTKIPELNRDDIIEDKCNILTQFGGPVEMGRGFILHSCEYSLPGITLPINNLVSLTATIDVIRDIITGNGPEYSIFAIGYTGWGPGQLENEIKNNGWLYCDTDNELIFGNNLDEKYDMAMAKIGINPKLLSDQVGHA